MENKETIIKLNIAFDYPVCWGMQRIMRDFIQNFYDNSGRESFNSDVEYIYQRTEDSYTVILDTKGKDFGYEWLIYIGASTKTGKKQYIGKYGEGFKVAALCLYRDYDAIFVMESQDWCLKPYTYTEEIDGTIHKMFGYRYSSRENDGHTRLTLYGINASKMNRQILEEALLDFYYPENPLFGEKVYADDKIGIYRRSDMTIPCHDYVFEEDIDVEGILYVKNLARGRLPFPFVICLNELHHEYRDYYYEDRYNGDRERNTYTDFLTIEILSKESEHFPANASYDILCVLKNLWNKLPMRQYDVETWYYFICQLVRNVSEDDDTRNRFMKEYDNLVYIERATPDRMHKKLINQTGKWWNECGDRDKKMVNPVFRLLGAENLVPIYEETSKNDFVKPCEIEAKRFEYIMTVASMLMGEGNNPDIPELLIYNSQEDYYNPDQYMKRLYSSRKSNKTQYKKYKIETVVMTHKDFTDENFEKTFVKAIDIFLHGYGTNKSEKLNSKLTEAGCRIINNSGNLDIIEGIWKGIA